MEIAGFLLLFATVACHGLLQQQYLHKPPALVFRSSLHLSMMPNEATEITRPYLNETRTSLSSIAGVTKNMKNPQQSRQRRRDTRNEIYSNFRWERAVKLENNFFRALDSMTTVVAHQDNFTLPIAFPPIRDCNAALATFGDGGDLLRALRLFYKMRKAAVLQKQLQQPPYNDLHIPAPTLVTYSTLMSRAVRAGKPRVALRLWALMRNQAEFFSSSNGDSTSSDAIVPDVKAANILMNCFARLADVESAQNLLQQMKYGNGTDVPRIQPNLVTYNTLLNACHKAGDLDAALLAKQQLDESGLVADTRTYTSLIGTVARRASAASGARDPTLAFALHKEMMTRNVRPNGMTYSALIDVCARCGRSDLALQGLRIMLRHKAQEQEALSSELTLGNATYTLENEVGAWSAAINACGNTGRIDSACRLFYSMPNFGVTPNTVTCGCLMDHLLKCGRTAETLQVLRYMKRERIPASEVMYTSLMTSAGRLAQIENRKRWASTDDLDESSSNDAMAIEVYTELMQSLMLQGGRGVKRRNEEEDSPHAHKIRAGKEESKTLLLRVFLVFQEMKAAGAQPDVACYNVLLNACARAADVRRARDVLRQLRADGLDPNHNTWREMLRAAAFSQQSKEAASIWEMAVTYRSRNQAKPALWKPSVSAFASLISAYIRHAESSDDAKTKAILYRQVVDYYKDVLIGSERLAMNRVDIHQLHSNDRAMLLILQAIVGLANLLDPEKDTSSASNQMQLRRLASSIATLECLSNTLHSSFRSSQAARQSLEAARSWTHS